VPTKIHSRILIVRNWLATQSPYSEQASRKSMVTFEKWHNYTQIKVYDLIWKRHFLWCKILPWDCETKKLFYWSYFIVIYQV